MHPPLKTKFRFVVCSLSLLKAAIIPPILLIVLVTVATSFASGEEGAEECDSARKIVGAMIPGSDSADQEKEILEICPDGAPGLFIKALRHERVGATDKAMVDYRATLAADDTFADAHGNLGLLLLQNKNPKEAVVELTRGLMGKPDPRYHAALAEILRDKAPTLALFHYGEALKASPGDLVLRLGWAQTLAETGQDDKAEREFRALLQTDAGNIAALLGLAKNLMKRGRSEDGLTMLNRAATIGPENKEVHRLLSQFYRMKGELEKAEQEERLAGISTDPEEHIRKGDTYLLARNYQKALEEYQAALKVRPQWQEALEKLGDAQRVAGHDDAAIETYKRLIGIDKSNRDTFYMLGVLYERKGVLNEAEGYYRQALQGDPGNGDARRRLADIYTLGGNFPLAVEEYRQLIAVRGDNPLVHFKLARVYERSKKYDEAIAEFRAAVGIAPDNIEAHRELAGLFLKRKMMEEAEGEYREVLRLAKDDIFARNALTAVLVKQKKYDELIALLEQGVELSPKDPNNHYKLGLVFDYKKDYQHAIEQYKETILLNDGHAKALNALGKVYLKQGDKEKGREMLEAAKKADPDLLETRELLSNLDPLPMEVKHIKSKRSKARKLKKGRKQTKLRSRSEAKQK